MPFEQFHLPWENTAHILQVRRQLQPLTHNFHPPGTHHCWVGRGSMEWGLPDTSIYDQQSESDPRPFDLKSVILSTFPCAPYLNTWNLWQYELIYVDLYVKDEIGFSKYNDLHVIVCFPQQVSSYTHPRCSNYSPTLAIMLATLE